MPKATEAWSQSHIRSNIIWSILPLEGIVGDGVAVVSGTDGAFVDVGVLGGTVSKAASTQYERPVDKPAQPAPIEGFHRRN
jgi:hypothetical protein